VVRIDRIVPFITDFGVLVTAISFLIWSKFDPPTARATRIIGRKSIKQALFGCRQKTPFACTRTVPGACVDLTTLIVPRVPTEQRYVRTFFNYGHGTGRCCRCYWNTHIEFHSMDYVVGAFDLNLNQV
jgi:hypothetical protein